MAEPQENGVKKGPWSIEEDEKLKDFIEKNGQGNWQTIPKQTGLNRCGKSCRLRWTNYLKPGIKRGEFSPEEEATIIALHKQLGNKWSKIASHLPRRTDNEIKNFWNTHLRKKLLRMRIDPKTHRRIPDLNLLNLSQAHELLSSSVSTPYNFISPLNAALAVQANANDLIKMQMIQNMLQVINPNPIPYIQGNANQLGDLIQFNRLFDGTNNNFTHVNPSQAQSSIMSDLSNISPMLNHEPSPSNSFPCFEGEIIPGGGMNDNIQGSCTSNMYNSEYSLPCYTSNNMYSSEYSLPSLVSVTPESFTTNNELESVKQSYTASEGLDQESNNVFDAWENLIDEENSSSFWKDILG